MQTQYFSVSSCCVQNTFLSGICTDEYNISYIILSLDFHHFPVLSLSLFFSLGSPVVYTISTGMQKNHLREKITNH